MTSRLMKPAGPEPQPPAGRLRGAGPAVMIGVVASLAAIAVDVHARARRAEREHPPLGRFVDVDGVRLHYVERGHGQPIVLLHGNGSMVQDFLVSGLVDLAARRYRVIAFDRPGYGYSARPADRLWTPQAQADLLVQAFRALGITQPVVVGHSWGALVTMAMAVAHSLTLRGVVLLSGYYFPRLRKDVAAMSIVAIPVLGDLVRHTILPFVGRLLSRRIARKLFAPAPVPASLAQIPQGLALRPSQLRASAREYAVMNLAAALLAQHYREVAMPTAILSGTGDQIVDGYDHSLRLHRMIRQSSIEFVPGAGHMVHHNAPDRVLATIDRVAA